MGLSQDVEVRVFPSSDRQLDADVRRVLLELPDDGGIAVARSTLETTLRAWYRNLRVVVRDDFATASGEALPCWYVLRDGRVRSHAAARERLYVALGHSRSTVMSASEESGRAAEVAKLAEETIATSRRRRAAHERGSPR